MLNVIVFYLLTCSPGGGYFVGHDSVCATISNLASSVDGMPGVVGCERKAGKLQNEKHAIRTENIQCLCALSFERHGFWAKETVGFIKRLATSRAVALGLDPCAEIVRWYAAISCCLQRSNAAVLRGEPVPGRPSPPTSRFAALGRDLRFAA